MKGVTTFNRRMVNDDGPDFYPTPRWGTLALLEHIGFTGPILEPCCGDGAMSRVLEEHQYEVISSDKYDRGYGTVRDFFDITQRASNLVTNPPFNLAEPLLEHALKITDRKICLLLRLAFLESKRRYDKVEWIRPGLKTAPKRP